jgi:hypothetical protein
MGLKLFKREPRGYKLQQNKKINRKSKFKKWLYRILFLLLLILLLHQFHHYDQVIEGLGRFNANQADIINTLDLKVHSLQMSNADLQSQVNAMQIKINGLEIHNQLQNQIHTVTPTEPTAHNVDVHSDLHNEVKINAPKIIDTSTMITTAAVTIITVIKGIGSFIPALH